MNALCPVCGAPLTETPRSWYCENRHSFDVARQGYVNLLTVDKKHSLHPGDTKEMVAARKAFLDGGYYRPIAERLCALVSAAVPHAAVILDSGCGEGYYLSAVGETYPDSELWGLDISRDAVRYAAVRNKRPRWIVGTAAALPFAEESFDALLSVFALTVEGEYARVLRPGGVFLEVLAGEEHLMGLKGIIYPEILRREKEQQRQLSGFTLERHETLEFDFTLADHAQVENLLSMTPHFWRISREGAERLAKTETLCDRAQVVFNLYRRD